VRQHLCLQQWQLRCLHAGLDAGWTVDARCSAGHQLSNSCVWQAPHSSACCAAQAVAYRQLNVKGLTVRCCVSVNCCREDWLGGVNKGEGELKERWGAAATGTPAADSSSSSSSSSSHERQKATTD
jgi:hypothetical protein